MSILIIYLKIPDAFKTAYQHFHLLILESVLKGQLTLRTTVFVLQLHIPQPTAEDKELLSTISNKT